MNTSQRDEAARILCEIIDDDAPLRWSRYRSVVDCIAGNNKLLSLLTYVPQWQTVKEFMANPVEGWCWICYGDKLDVDIAYYSGKLFYFDDACDRTVYDVWNESTISHVMLIPKPKVPK